MRIPGRKATKMIVAAFKGACLHATCILSIELRLSLKATPRLKLWKNQTQQSHARPLILLEDHQDHRRNLHVKCQCSIALHILQKCRGKVKFAPCSCSRFDSQCRALGKKMDPSKLNCLKKCFGPNAFSLSLTFFVHLRERLVILDALNALNKMASLRHMPCSQGPWGCIVVVQS